MKSGTRGESRLDEVEVWPSTGEEEGLEATRFWLSKGFVSSSSSSSSSSSEPRRRPSSRRSWTCLDDEEEEAPPPQSREGVPDPVAPPPPAPNLNALPLPFPSYATSILLFTSSPHLNPGIGGLLELDDPTPLPPIILVEGVGVPIRGGFDLAWVNLLIDASFERCSTGEESRPALAGGERPRIPGEGGEDWRKSSLVLLEAKAGEDSTFPPPWEGERGMGAEGERAEEEGSRLLVMGIGSIVEEEGEGLRGPTREDWRDR